MRWLIWIWVVMLSLPLQAQLNEADSLRWKGKLSMSGSVLAGNIDRWLLQNRAEAAHADSLWGLSSRNDYQYGKAFGSLTENDLVSTNFLYLRPPARTYPYIMALVETNYRRQIHFRYQVGPGLSHNLFRNAHHLIRLSATATWESTRFGQDRFDVDYYDGSNLVNTTRLTGRLFGLHHVGKVELAYEFWFQQSLMLGENYRYYTEETVEVPLAKHISFRAALRYSYEHVELVGYKPYDLFMSYGLSIGNF